MTDLIVFSLGAGMALTFLFLARLASAKLEKRQLNKRLSSVRTRPKSTEDSPIAPRKGVLLSLHYFLLSAGLRISPKTFIMVPAIAATAGAGILLAWTGQVWVSGFALLFTLALPGVYILWKRKEIQRKIVVELPEAAGMVVRALGIGMAVDAALKEAGDSLSGPLGMEIKIIYREMAVGIPFSQAFQGFAQRYPSLPDVNLFCTAFILQRETGGNLAELLHSLAQTIQNRFTFKRQIKTYTAEARMSAIIISLLPLLFALAAWFMNPGYIGKLTGTPVGRGMIYGAVVLEILGFMVMRKMAQVKI